MSHHYIQQSDDVQYDPLPLGQEHAQDVLYNETSLPAPPSPDAQTLDFYTPNQDPVGLPEGNLPQGAGPPQPRFLGAALYDDGTARPRDSIASSHRSLAAYGGGGGDGNSSIYGLNYGGVTTPSQRDSFAGTYRDDPNESGFYGEQVPIGSLSQGKYLGDKRAIYAPPREKSKRKYLLLGVLGALMLIIAAVLVPLYFVVFKKHDGSTSDNNNGTTGGGGGDGGNSSSPTGTPQGTTVVTGGDGSKVTLEDGSTFTYSNAFGGSWYWDANDPFNNGAQAQSWTPGLNQTFNFGVDRIRGYVTLRIFIMMASY